MLGEIFMKYGVKFNAMTLGSIKITDNCKGYDAYQVDTILDNVIEDYEFYEKFYKEAKSYIAELEEKVSNLKKQLQETEVELSKYKAKFDIIKDSDRVTSENIDLLTKIKKYENALYARGIDPTKL